MMVIRSAHKSAHSKILEPVPPKKGVRIRIESLILFSHEPTVRVKVELTGNSLKAYSEPSQARHIKEVSSAHKLNISQITLIFTFRVATVPTPTAVVPKFKFIEWQSELLASTYTIMKN